jgi:hypothetical protein
MHAARGLNITNPEGPFSVSKYTNAVHTQCGSIFGDPDMARLEPYSFVLTNASGKAIHGLTVRWTLTDEQGKQRLVDYASDSFFLTRTSLVPAGAQLLVTPTLLISAPPTRSGGTIGPASEMARRDAGAFDLASGRAVSLAAIILEDGTLYGPDQSETVKSIDGRLRPIRLLLSSANDSEALSRIAQSRPERGDHAGMWAQRLARQAQSDRAFVRALAGVPTITIHRGQ